LALSILRSRPFAAWENLRPKLIPLLEVNRAARLEREKSVRKQSRKERLDRFLTEIKAARAPIIDVTIRTPAVPPAPSSGDEHSPIAVKHVGVFPDIADALEWPVVKNLHETDVPVAEMETQLEEHRAEIGTELNDWISRVESRVAKLLRIAREADDLTPEAPDLTLPVEEGSTANLLQDVSADLKLLLRADSLFESTRSASLPPLAYDAMIASGYGHTYDPLRGMRASKTPLDFTKFKCHTGAQTAARALLEDLGKPDATYLEMRSPGQRYACGRCHDGAAKTWEEIVGSFTRLHCS
jgi:hypothetical protein